MKTYSTTPRPLLIAALVLTIALTTTAPGCTGSEPAGQGAAADSGGSLGVGASSTGVSPTSSTASTGETSSSASVAVRTSTTTELSPVQMVLEQMTPRDKAAQVLLLAFDGTTVESATKELLLESPPGGFLLFSRNVNGPNQLKALCAALQETVAAGGAQAGLFVAVDQEGGSVQRIHSGVPRVPAARTLGDAGSLLEARRLATETATALLALGVNTNLAPVADVVSDPQSFLYERTYGGDPTVVADFVEAVTDAYVENGLIVVVKHFPGHGSASGNSHSGPVLSDATEFDLATIHLPPFRVALSSGADGVMMGHIVVNAYDPTAPASTSKIVIQEVLREGLDFDGMVVTDDLEMVGASAGFPRDSTSEGNNPGELAVSALEAGCDLLISTGTLADQRAMIDAIVEAVESGRLSQARLDQAVEHVLTVKLHHGLISALSSS